MVVREERREVVLKAGWPGRFGLFWALLRLGCFLVLVELRNVIEEA